MSGAKLRWTLSIAMCGVVLLPSLAIAQMQQAGNQESPGGPQSHSDATANPPAANSSRAGSGASSWSAGQSGFGTGGKMPGATNGAVRTTGGVAASDTGHSSWVAGGGSFGSTVQTGGIWRENSGNAETTSAGSANKPANGVSVPAISPNFQFVNPAFAKKPSSAPPAHAMVSHAPTSHQAGVGTRLGGSNVSRSSISGRASKRPATAGLHSRTNMQRPSIFSKGSGTKPSGVGSTRPIPFGFAPSSGTPDAGTPDAGAAPKAPPL